MFALLIAAAHAGEPLRPHDLWGAWTFEPVTLVALAASAWLYGVGLRRLWHAAGVGRGVRRWQAWMFGAGWMLLALSQLSPLHALGGALFSAHMAQHEILMTVAAPLLVLGRPLIPFVWALTPRWRRATGQWGRSAMAAATWRAIANPFAAFLIHGAAIWLWHAPPLYDATVTSDVVHAAQHASFLLTALLFWWVVLRPSPARGGAPVAIAVLFGTLLHTGALGAMLTLTSRLIYTSYAATTIPWGLRAVEDQQLGGVIMWVPGGLAYVVAALMLVARLLGESGRRAVEREASDGRARNVSPHGIGWHA